MSARGTLEPSGAARPAVLLARGTGPRPQWVNRFEFAVAIVFGGLPLLWDACYAFGAPARADTVVRAALYLGVALAFARLAVPMDRDGAALAAPRRRGARDLLAGAGAALGVEAVGLHWILFSNAVPVLRHDWTWPISSLEVRGLGTLASEAWVPSGLGSPKAFPTLYVLDAPLAWLAQGIDSHAVLMVALLVCALLAGLGLVLLMHRMLGIPLGATLLAIVVYVGSPFAFDELVAGHLPNLLAFGLLPFVPLLTIALGGPAFAGRRAQGALGIGLGLVVALSAAQIQYVVFDAVAAAIALVVRPVALGRLALAAGAALLVVAGAHGQSFAHLAAPGDHGARSAGPSPLEWFFTLSKPATPTLAQSGYIGGYADANRLLPPIAQTALLSTLAWFAAGFALARGRRPGLFFVALLLAGIIGATGVYGPFAALKLSLTSIRAMTALREAYNWQCLSTLGIAGCAALALGASARQFTALGARYAEALVAALRSAAWALTAIGAYATLSGASTNELHVKVEGPAQAAARAIVAADAGDGRVAMLPLIEPIRQDAYAYGGSEPYWAGFGGHPVLTEFDPDSAYATAALLLERADPEPGLRLLGRLGVKYVVLRGDLVSDLPQYWFPELFPPGWSTRDAYPRLQASPLLIPRSSDPEFGLYELATYRRPLSLATAQTTCSGRSAILALAEAPGALRPCSDPRGSGALRRVALTPDGTTFDPAKAWISATKLFSLGSAFAATGGALGTTGSGVTEQRFTAETSDDVAVPCIALRAPLAALDGGAFRPLACAGDLDGAPRWTYFRGLGRRAHTLVVVGRGGDAMIGPVALGASSARRSSDVDRIAYAMPQNAQASLAYRRIAPERAEGTVTAAHGTILLFSDAYDDRWRLHLAGGATVEPMRANELESAFAIPPGTHAFTLQFEPSRADRALDALQGITWPLAAASALVLGLFAYRARRDTGPSGAA